MAFVVKLPGLIDVHVHLREPGAIHKEDFSSGTRAAVKGGFTMVLDMPNNPVPTISVGRLKEKFELAESKAICDVGFHFGTNGKNENEFPDVWSNPKVFGLKVYCNHTTGEMLIEDNKLLEEVFKRWNSAKPILVHAEGEQLEMAINLAGKFGRDLHVCHISQAKEVQMVRKAKRKGQQITAGVTPHHLFLTEVDVDKLGPKALMKPPLGKQEDQYELWKGINDETIDLVETDHAPHTLEEKSSTNPPFGVPGLETALGLMYFGVNKKLIGKNKILDLFYTNPGKIFKIRKQKNTYIEIDENRRWVVGEGGYETKCGWSPFAGWELPIKVMTVVLRGKTIVKDGKIVFRN